MSSWRMIHKKDGTNVLRSPEGKDYRGTASEIRGAAMTPGRRRMLADALRVDWATTTPRTAERKELVAAARLDAIRGSAADDALNLGNSVGLPPVLAIEAAAAARAQGQTLAEFVAQWVEAGIEAAKDDAPGGDIQLTRHERAAIERIEGKEVAA